MELIELEVFSSGSNQAVVRMPGRRFPGSVIQGDSLSILYSLARELAAMVQASPDEELRDTVEERKDLLEGRLRFYDAVLEAHGLKRPYVNPFGEANHDHGNGEERKVSDSTAKSQASDLPKIGAPATRALQNAGYVQLEQLTQVREAELLRLHGMGPKAIRILREALAARGQSFAPEEGKE